MYDDSHCLTSHDVKNEDKAIEDIFSWEWYMRNIMGYNDEELKKADPQISKEVKKKQGGAKYILAKKLFDLATLDSLDKDVALDSSAKALFEKLQTAINGDNK